MALFFTGSTVYTLASHSICQSLIILYLTVLFRLNLPSSML